ncbi:hypothetical protein BKA69DRAFT_1076915 [Paraphysoderma sedebokerense]|nr:hypothetical protein BKA69DRAFT_1076915 [Paraphysoderma sedebokerense]
MRLHSAILLLSLLSQCFGANVKPPGLKPDPSQVFIEQINYGGSGCPGNSVAASFNDEKTVFTLLFEKFIANAGPTTSPGDAQKNCNLNIKVHLPKDYEYGISTFDYRGFIQLDAGVKAMQTNTYHFGKEKLQRQMPFNGPLTEDYTVRDTCLDSEMVWSGCGGSRNMKVQTEMSVDNSANRNGQGLMTTDSIDGKVKQVLGLKWRKCNGGKKKLLYRRGLLSHKLNK